MFKKAELITTFLILSQGPLHGMGFAFLQKGSPLQIVGVTTDANVKDFYSNVIAINVSSKPILRAQFGWIMSDFDTKRVFGVGYGPLADLNLSPLEVGQVGTQGATFSFVAEKTKGSKHVSLVLGVVYVKFQDGSEWSYSMEQHGKFEEGDDPALMQQISPKVHEFRVNNGLLRASIPPTRPKSSRQHQGLLAWLSNLFSLQTVHAQAPIFVCNPSPRDCEQFRANSCTTFFCDLDTCNFSQCCVITGDQVICG